jgi:hypothetical protein
MSPFVHLCTLVALCAVSEAAEKKKPLDSPAFKQGVYTGRFHTTIYRFEKERFERWANIGPPMGPSGLRPTGSGTYSVTGNELRLKFEKGEPVTWTYRLHEGKPSLWDVGSFALWENMGKVADSGILYWTKSTPQEILRDHPISHE